MIPQDTFRFARLTDDALMMMSQHNHHHHRRIRSYYKHSTRNLAPEEKALISLVYLYFKHTKFMRRERRRPAPKRDMIVAPSSLAPRLLLFALVTLLIHGAVVIRADDACESFDFEDSQEKHYGKTNFKVHSHVAETVGNILSVFYDESQEAWTISPEDLREIVLSNIHAVEGTIIYGSAIAFEPNLWRQTEGLPDGVPFPAASEACLNLSERYCEAENNLTSDGYRIDTLVNNSAAETLYSPYAYHGSPDEQAFANWYV